MPDNFWMLNEQQTKETIDLIVNHHSKGGKFALKGGLNPTLGYKGFKVEVPDSENAIIIYNIREIEEYLHKTATDDTVKSIPKDQLYG